MGFLVREVVLIILLYLSGAFLFLLDPFLLKVAVRSSPMCSVNLRTILVTSLVATAATVAAFMSSCRTISLSPEIRTIVRPYREILNRTPPEERREFIKLLEEGLTITEEQHQREIRDIIQAFKDYYQNDPNKGALILLADEDLIEYKNKNFDSLNEVLIFLRNTKERANIYVSKKNALAIEYVQYKKRYKIFYYLCIDHNANGMHMGEEDYFYVSEFLPGTVIKPCHEWNFEFENGKKEPHDLMRKDFALNKYKIVIHRIIQVLKNKTDLGHLIVKYTLKALPQAAGDSI